MSLNQQCRFDSIYRSAGAAPELHLNTQVWLDPNNTSHSTTGPIGGSGLTTLLIENNNSNKQPYNRALVFGEKIYWLQGNEIFSLNYQAATRTGGSNGAVKQQWNSSYILPTGATGFAGRLRSLNTGLYSVMISGVSNIITIYCPDDLTYVAARFNIATSGWTNGKVFTPPPSFSISEASGGFRSEILFENKLYACGNRGYLIYDPQVDLFTQGNWPANIVGPYDWCPYMGKLWGVGKKSTDGSIGIYDMTNGPVLKASTTGFGLANDETLEGRAQLFTDRTYLYAIYYSSGNPQTGFGIYQFVGNNAGNMSFVGDISNTTSLGSSAKNGGADANNSQRYRCNTFLAQNPNPDGTEGITFFFDRGGASGSHITPGIGQLYQQYVWTGPGTNLSFDEGTVTGRIGNGTFNPGDLTGHQLTYTNTKNGAGDRIYNLSSEPEPRIQIRSISTSGSVVTINYGIVTNPINFANGTQAAVQFRYDANYHSPRNWCYLQNPSPGSMLGVNTVVVSADSGTVYSIQWNAAQNGFNSSRIKSAIVGFISTTGTA